MVAIYIYRQRNVHRLHNAAITSLQAYPAGRPIGTGEHCNKSSHLGKLRQELSELYGFPCFAAIANFPSFAVPR